MTLATTPRKGSLTWWLVVTWPVALYRLLRRRGWSRILAFGASFGAVFVFLTVIISATSGGGDTGAVAKPGSNGTPVAEPTTNGTPVAGTDIAVTKVVGAQMVTRNGYLSEWTFRRHNVRIVGTVTPKNAAVTIRSGHGDPPKHMGATATVPVQDGRFAVSVKPSGEVMQYELTTGDWTATVTLRRPGYNPAAPISAQTRAKVTRTLVASVAHYANLLHRGETILGNAQYASGMAGDAAFNDPNSAASRFSTYQTRSNPTGDLSFLNAFDRADSYYTADNEPNAISAWRDDMSLATSALSEWVDIAIDWQIRDRSTADLQRAERKVTAALAKARGDIARINAGR